MRSQSEYKKNEEPGIKEILILPQNQNKNLVRTNAGQHIDLPSSSETNNCNAEQESQKEPGFIQQHIITTRHLNYFIVGFEEDFEHDPAFKFFKLMVADLQEEEQEDVTRWIWKEMDNRIIITCL